MIDDLFKIEPIKPHKMNSDEFFRKTKELLLIIDHKYSNAWQNRHLDDTEYPDESICNKCTGSGSFKSNEDIKDCYNRGEEGFCYHRFCDYEQVGMDLEDCLGSIYELLSVDEITNKNDINHE